MQKTLPMHLNTSLTNSAYFLIEKPKECQEQKLWRKQRNPLAGSSEHGAKHKKEKEPPSNKTHKAYYDNF